MKSGIMILGLLFSTAVFAGQTEPTCMLKKVLRKHKFLPKCSKPFAVPALYLEECVTAARDLVDMKNDGEWTIQSVRFTYTDESYVIRARVFSTGGKVEIKDEE